MSLLITLVEKVCVIVLLGYIVSRAPFMRPYVEERSSPLRSHFLLGLIFGLFSIYGTLGGIPLMGAVVNIRDAGPLIAGLVGGTVPGLLAGLIGGSHRLLMGLLDWERFGFTCVACSLSTVLIGLISGLIHRRWGVVRPVQAVAIAALSEAGHMALGVLIAGSPEQMLRLDTMRFAWNNIVGQAAPPMIIANAMGVGVFFTTFFLYRRELEAYRERDAFYREVEQRNIELRSVYEIAQALTASSIDPDQTMRTILERVRQMMAYDGAEVCLYTPEENILQLQACIGDHVFDSQDQLYRLGEGFAGWMGQQHRSLLVDDVHEPPQLTPELPRVGPESPIRSYVGVPLMVGDQLVGTLGLAGTRTGMFDAHKQRLLETIAPQAAIAIHNARQVRKRENSLRRQIEELRIEIDRVKQARQVAEITETEYFRTLREHARRLRARSEDSGRDRDEQSP